MHRLTATATGPDAAAIAAQIRALHAAPAATRPDLVEVRLDAIWPTTPDALAATDHLVTLLDAAGDLPLLATLRPARQGGGFEGDETIRVSLLAAAAKAGFAIDLEADLQDLPALVAGLHEDARHIVLSHHLAKAPSTDDGLHYLTRMQDAHADCDKLAFPADGFLGVLRALELTHRHAKRTGQPCVAPMGEHAPEVRAALGAIGNAATYAHPDDAEPAAPGQPSLSALAAVWRHWGLGRDQLGPHPLPDTGPPATAPDWYAVIGTPVAHSLSPRIHNAAFAAAGRDARYVSLDVPRNHAMVLAMNAHLIGLRGASVTAPLKEEAARLMGHRDAIVDDVGAANCLRFDTDGAIHATNTDATALKRLLAKHAGAPAIVLGAGGAARAALWALRALGCPTTVVARRLDAAQAVADSFGATAMAWPSGDAPAADLTHDAIVINATPRDDDRLAPWATGAACVLDMVYRDHPTPLEAAAAATAATAGATVITGRDLLVEQAVDAYRFWTGDAPDRHAMLRSLEAAS